MILSSPSSWPWLRCREAVALAALLAAQKLQQPAPGEFTAIRDVALVTPFVMAAGYHSAWQAERPWVQAGYLVVLETDPALCEPRQELEPLLLCGAQTVERINHGRGSGRIVAVVPARLVEGGGLGLDLRQAPVFWAPPHAPEQVDLAATTRLAAEAGRAGIQPLPAERLAAAARAGGGLVRFADRDELVRHAARLILQHSPAEKELAEGLLVPVVR